MKCVTQPGRVYLPPDWSFIRRWLQLTNYRMLRGRRHTHTCMHTHTHTCANTETCKNTHRGKTWEISRWMYKWKQTHAFKMHERKTKNTHILYTQSVYTHAKTYTHTHTFRRGYKYTDCLPHSHTRTNTNTHIPGFQLVSGVFTCLHHFVVWREASKVIRSWTNRKPGRAGE